jgi:signal transduction histidine kinase
MTVKQKIQVYLSVLIICTAIIGATFVERVSVTKRIELTVNKISQVTSETILLSRLTEIYIGSPSAVVEKEWLTKYRFVQTLLEDPALKEHESHQLFQELVRTSNTVGAIFAQLSSESSNQGVRERLGDQILLLTENFAVVSSNVERNIFIEAEGSQRTTTLFFIISFAIIFAIMVSIWLLIARQISKPITELTDAVNRIDAGDFSARAPSKAKDEIGALGTAFNNMVKKLQNRTRDLQEVNSKDKILLVNLDERVAELEAAKKAIANLLEDVESDRNILSEAKAKDDALIDNIGDGMIVVDREKRIRVINKAAENLLGLKRENVLDKEYYTVFNNKDVDGNIIPNDQRPIAIVLSSGQKFTTPVLPPPTSSTMGSSASPIGTLPQTPIFYVRSDGTSFPVALTITPVVVNNEIIGAIDIFRDITQEREIEKLRIDFLSLASHQLRTPLSGIKWLIETIRRGVVGKTTEKQKAYLDQIYLANERMIVLVSDMLEVLKLESSSLILKKERVPLYKFYSELAVAMEPIAKKNRVILVNKATREDKMTVSTDLNMLRVCMENFISNGIHYSKPGQEVIIDFKNEASGITLSVKDSGIGIPKVEQPRIFERFYRASNAKELVPDGTGLGLYRSLLFAEKIGAKISFESEEGKGTTFYFHIPSEAGAVA